MRIAPDELRWLRPDRALQPGQTVRLRVRIRYRQPLQGATLIQRTDALYILFDEPQRGVSAGQFAVWYDGDALLGSGVIAWQYEGIRNQLPARTGAPAQGD